MVTPTAEQESLRWRSCARERHMRTSYRLYLDVTIAPGHVEAAVQQVELL
jgi:hypothetical protein